MIRTLRSIVLFFLISLGATLTARAQTDVLLAASGTLGTPGSLYILNPINGSVLGTIGALNDILGNNYGLTGLRYDPANGILYGATLSDSPNDPNYLVKVNPLTGLVTPIGPLGAPLTDLALDPATNIFYGVSGTTQKFYQIDPSTGAATQIGSTGISFQNGGGLAANSAGTLYGVNLNPNNAPDSIFYTYSKSNGMATEIADTGLTNYVRALAFNSNDTLYGIEGGNGDVGGSGKALRDLITINVQTGAVTDLGASVNNLDAIAFVPLDLIPEGSPLTLFVLGICIVGFVSVRRGWRGERLAIR
jgi:hypothetical protein